MLQNQNRQAFSLQIVQKRIWSSRVAAGISFAHKKDRVEREWPEHGGLLAVI